MTFLLWEKRLLLSESPTLYLHMCQFDGCAYGDHLFERFGITRPYFARSAGDTRKAEHLAGRICVSRAIKELGQPDSSIDIGAAGEPIWPEPITGSVTHTRSHAAAIVASRSEFGYIGVDCESILSADVCDEIESQIVSENEKRLLLRQFDDWPTALTIAFSVKESLFKAIFPVLGNVLALHDMQITRICPQEHSAWLQIIRPEAADIASRVCHGHYFRFNSGLIVTWFAMSFESDASVLIEPQDSINRN